MVWIGRFAASIPKEARKAPIALNTSATSICRRTIAETRNLPAYVLMSLLLRLTALLMCCHSRSMMGSLNHRR